MDKRAFHAVCVALLLLGLVVSNAAHGQSFTVGPFTISCVSSGQLCSPAFSVPVTTSGVLQVSYTASPGHCSDVSVHFLVDGIERGVTAFLAPGITSPVFDLGPVTAGTHTLALQAEGTVGGCNTGSVGNWGGSANVTVSGSSIVPASIPGPGMLATAGLLVLGVLALRRRLFSGPR
ncbi:MAG TPA: hypothetical protein VJV77_04620 [Casimicrobiaceae bacterium]|nr:hypothetical protein [Casimicrobiaceae bacterium]